MHAPKKTFKQKPSPKKASSKPSRSLAYLPWDVQQRGPPPRGDEDILGGVPLHAPLAVHDLHRVGVDHAPQPLVESHFRVVQHAAVDAVQTLDLGGLKGQVGGRGEGVGMRIPF